MKKTSSPKAPPTWWSPTSAIWLVLAFAALAGVPYLFSAGKVVSRGENLTLESVQKEAMKEYKKGEPEEKKREIKAYLTDAKGVSWVGNKMGLYRLENAEWKPVKDYPGEEVKSMAMSKEGHLIAVDEHKVYERDAAGTWQTAHEGECHAVNTSPDGAVSLILKKTPQVLRRMSAGKWETTEVKLPEAK
jgi:hypothetical protein